jgi:hypothetical protein
LKELAGNVLDLRQDCRERRRIARRFVSRRQRGCDLGTLDCMRQECGGLCCITGGADVNVNDLAVLVDRAKRVRPPAGNPDIYGLNANDKRVSPHPFGLSA